MYNINFKKCMNFLTWDAIYIGIKEEIIPLDSAIIYASELVEKQPEIDSTQIIQLLITDIPEKDKILSQIREITANKSKAKNKEKEAQRILRYAVLLSMQIEDITNAKLLERAEEIYASFDYPKDMESFISYMPVKGSYDVSAHTAEENEQRLIDEFETFMHNEYKWIELINN